MARRLAVLQLLGIERLVSQGASAGQQPIRFGQITRLARGFRSRQQSFDLFAGSGNRLDFLAQLEELPGQFSKGLRPFLRRHLFALDGGQKRLHRPNRHRLLPLCRQLLPQQLLNLQQQGFEFLVVAVEVLFGLLDQPRQLR